MLFHNVTVFFLLIFLIVYNDTILYFSTFTISYIRTSIKYFHYKKKSEKIDFSRLCFHSLRQMSIRTILYRFQIKLRAVFNNDNRDGHWTNRMTTRALTLIWFLEQIFFLSKNAVDIIKIIPEISSLDVVFRSYTMGRNRSRNVAAILAWQSASVSSGSGGGFVQLLNSRVVNGAGALCS